jgi:hypothetical protein
MSDETVLKFKLATLASISIGLLTIAVSVICIWVGYVSSQTTQNTTDIATLKECTRNMQSSTARIEVGVENINRSLNEHIRRGK